MNLSLPHTPIPLGLKFLKRKARVNPLIVNYHMVSDQQLPYIKNLYLYRNVDTFVRDLDFYNKYYHPIGMAEFLDSIKNGTELAENSVLITFDDGFREMSEIAAPLLLEKKIPATFFITTDFIDNQKLNHDNKQSLLIDHLKGGIPSTEYNRILKLMGNFHIPGKHLYERILNIPYKESQLLEQIATIVGMDFSSFLRDQKPYMTSAQIKGLLADGFTVGGHSCDHARFSELSLEEQIEQIRLSIDSLVERFSIDYRVFAFPYSDRGANTSLFEAVSKEINASFGTHGLLEDPVETHFQRISVEKFDQSAKKTIKYHYGRRFVYNLLNREYIQRQ